MGTTPPITTNNPQNTRSTKPDQTSHMSAGSSPLTRGKLAGRDGDVPSRGLIPACAGKTPGNGRRNRRGRDHPRSHRENVVCFCAPSAVQGSSPLTRGKHGVELGVRLVVGLTPRSRGENRSAATPIRSLVGSSPLTRGKQGLAKETGLSGRLIPAHAGKTSTTTGRPGNRTAHPRSRGENVSMAPLGDQGWWLIPAHAGKTR